MSFFENDEHEQLKEFLAVHPERGNVIPGANGIRQFRWPIGKKRKSDVQIIYYFRDLNMPLYLIALFPPGEWVMFDAEFCGVLAGLVNELVEEHGKQLASLAASVKPIA